MTTSTYRAGARLARPKDLSPEGKRRRAWYFAAKSTRAGLDLTERALTWSASGRFYAEEPIERHFALGAISLLHALLGEP